MRFDIKPLLKDANQVLSIDIKEEDKLILEDYADYHFTAPLQFQGQILSENSGILRIKGEVSIPYESTCVRCLDEVKEVFLAKVDERVYPDNYKEKLIDEMDLTEEETEDLFPEIEEDPDELLYHNRSYIDLSKFLKDQILLSLPIAQYCSEDCPGLCSQCGKKKDDPACKCEEKINSDSPFAILQDLL